MINLLKNLAFVSLIIASSLNVGICGDKSKDDCKIEDAVFKAYTFMHGREDYGDKLQSKIIEVMANPMNACIDFSLVGLNDKDLEDVFKGLIQRELNTQQDKTTLQLLNIESDDITQDGLRDFFQHLQKGSILKGSQSKVTKRIIPDVRGTVVKIGISPTREFLEKLQSVAPGVFAGSLRVVY